MTTQADAAAYWLGRIRQECEAAGLTLERLTTVRAGNRGRHGPPTVPRRPRDSAPLLKVADDAA